MFTLSVLFYWIGFKDHRGSSWRRFFREARIRDPHRMLWRISQGWREVRLKRGRRIPIEAAIADGFDVVDKQNLR